MEIRLPLDRLHLPSLRPSLRAEEDIGKIADKPVRFFFGSDTHDGYALVDEFIQDANGHHPDFVLGGGDFSEKGTAAEDQIFQHLLGKLDVPFVALPGNHDARGRGLAAFEREYGTMPRTFDAKGVHFVLLNDEDQTISEATFAFLERDLAANRGKPTIVSMHVPPVYPDPPKILGTLNKLMPGTIAMPKVMNPAQVRRFTDLMSRYHVQAVLSGHTHKPFEASVGGVRYVVAGAVGGKLMTGGHEYLDIKVSDGKVAIRHVPLDRPKSLFRNLMADAGYYLTERHMIKTVSRHGVEGLGPLFPFEPGGIVQGFKHGVAKVLSTLFKLPVIGDLMNRAYGMFTYPRHDTPKVDNLARVGLSLIRGGQPTREGFESLHMLGVKTIINLRPEEQWEKPWVEAAGMRYVYLPLPAVASPSVADGLKFLSIATDPANGQVFFHCQHGSDRTGAMAAIYRIAVDHWSTEHAISEMYRYGFHAGVEDAKIDFVRQFAGYWEQLPVGQRAHILHQAPSQAA